MYEFKTTDSDLFFGTLFGDDRFYMDELSLAIFIYMLDSGHMQCKYKNSIRKLHFRNHYSRESRIVKKMILCYHINFLVNEKIMTKLRKKKDCPNIYIFIIICMYYVCIYTRAYI